MRIIVNNLPDFHHIQVHRFMRWVDVLAANDDGKTARLKSPESDEIPDGLLSYY